MDRQHTGGDTYGEYDWVSMATVEGSSFYAQYAIMLLPVRSLSMLVVIVQRLSLMTMISTGNVSIINFCVRVF